MKISILSSLTHKTPSEVSQLHLFYYSFRYILQRHHPVSFIIGRAFYLVSILAFHYPLG